MKKSAYVNVRFTPEEARHIKEIVKANSGTISEFIRMCVNTQLAQVGDPKGEELLTGMIEKGMRDLVAKRVQAALKEKKRA